MTCHRIRLREPWKATLLGELPQAICYQRKFHRPTGLLPTQAVFLSVELYASCDVALNVNDQLCAWESSVSLSSVERLRGDQPTSRASNARAAATFLARIDRFLMEQNRVSLTVACPNDFVMPRESPPHVGQGIIREVALCIYEPDVLGESEPGVLGDSRTS